MTANDLLRIALPGLRFQLSKLSFTLLMSVWIVTAVSAQNFDNYQPIRASGPIPEDFLLSSLEKYKSELNQIAQDKRNLRNAKKEFFEESYYYINQMLLSGKVVFNDSVSEYVSEIADYLLRDQPELRKELRFYAVKSSSVNAFTTNNGLVLVNMGLLSHLENEAQLAFVLCHEISHYRKKHPMAIFLNSKKQEKNTTTVFNRNNLDTDLFSKKNYSHEKEEEADLMGLELFLQTDYDLHSIQTAF